LLHTLQTVGLLSNKAARRVYSKVIHQLNTLKENALTTYVNGLVKFLHLTKYIYTVNEKEKVHVNGEKKEETQNEKKDENEKKKSE